MSGTITNGLSALIAAQRALQTTSNNIANANTAGYVRQRIDFVEQPGTPLGRITIGAGVAVADVSRVYDQFLTDNLRTSTSLEQRYAAFGDFATRLDTILGNPDTGVSASVQRFFDQVEAVGRDPTSIAQRQQLLLEGDSLATRLKQLDSQLEGLGNEINSRLSNAANTINQLTAQIADVNAQVISAGGSAAPSLLDKRDELLKALGAQIDITTVRQADGGVNVLVGSGQSVVLGNRSIQLATVPDTYDGSRLQLAVNNGGTLQNISTKVNGGIVGGLLAFRNDVLDGSRRDLGQLATGLADTFNTQHRQGMDLQGNLGGDFFATTAPRTAAAGTNTGTAAVTAVIADASGLTGRDYELRFNGSAWSVLDRQTGAFVTATGTGTAANPLVFAGLSVSATAGAAAGDRFLVQPLANATSDFRVALTAPAEIAAAAPLVSRVASTNASQATVSAPVVNDITDPTLDSMFTAPVPVTATIIFDTPSSYRVFTSDGSALVGPFAYTSGDDISFGGWTVQVTGAPQANDRFFVSAAAAGSGDNSNALALSSVAQKGFFAGGTQSITDLGADIIASVGSTANRASNEIKVQEALREQAEIDLQNISGVNLDEEAANMLKYQQAYLAASKVISVADGLFQNLLQIVGR
jgi:flagellar hook-associated protein 1